MIGKRRKGKGPPNTGGHRRGSPIQPNKHRQPTARQVGTAGAQPVRNQQVRNLLVGILGGIVRLTLYEVFRSVLGPHLFEIVRPFLEWLLSRISD